MAQCAKDNWQIKFRRMMNQEVYTEWTELTKLLEAAKITDTEDMVVWGLTKNGRFSIKSLYNFLTSGGVTCRMARKIWICRLPLKIRIFLW
jgi:hypothetical protein